MTSPSATAASPVAASPTAPQGAVAPRQRLPSLDILRGFALLGILVMNMPGFSWTYWPGKLAEELWPAWWDVAELWTARWLFSGKFNSLFSFLFGLGFALQLERLARAPRPFAGIYLRKMAVLLAFGLLHAVFLWFGDVLVTYVELGLALLVLRKLPDRWVLALAAVALLAGPVGGFVRIQTTTAAEWQALRAERMERTTRADAAYRGSDYVEATRVRAAWLAQGYTDPWTYYWRTSMLATTLLGLFAARRRYVTEPSRHRRALRRIFLGSAAFGTVSIVAFSIARGYLDLDHPGLGNAIASVFYNLQRPAIMVAYASGLLLLLQRDAVRRRLAVLAYAGRMPLTNYIMQSVICTGLFYGYGLGLYGQVGPAAGFAIAIALFAAQVVASKYLLARFDYGPLEWLWRRLTYGRRPRGATAIDAVGARATA